MIYAELDAAGWALIITAAITAILTGLTVMVVQVTQLVLGFLRERAKIKRDEAIADKVEEVRRTAAIAAAEVVNVKNDLSASNTKLSGEIKEVHDLTNSMKTELVNEVRQAAHAAGVKEEKDREGVAKEDKPATKLDVIGTDVKAIKAVVVDAVDAESPRP